MYRGVIFDYGKVISDASGMNIRADIANAFGVTEGAVEQAMREYMPDFRTGKISENTFWKNLAAFFEKPLPVNTTRLWKEPFVRNVKIYGEMLKFVRMLRKKDIKTAVLSNNIQPWVNVIRQKGGYDDFDVVVNSCEVGYSKPDSKIFELTLEKLHLNAVDVIFVDDREENLQTARLLGMATVKAQNTHQTMRSIQELLN